MSDIYAVKEKLHNMRAKLYPSYLPGTEGKYIARTTNEAAVNVREISASAKNRGGYDGSIHPNICGLFAGENEIHNHKDHPIDFRFQALKPLRDLRDSIEVLIEGIADTHGYIMDFTDVATGAVNESFSQMNEFIITGYKLKIAGDSPEVGLYFQNTATGAMTRAHSLAENSSSKLIGIFPGIPDAEYKVVIKTQFTGSGSTFLKPPAPLKAGSPLRNEQ